MGRDLVALWEAQTTQRKLRSRNRMKAKIFRLESSLGRCLCPGSIVSVDFSSDIIAKQLG
jgi:hypothetical protein